MLNKKTLKKIFFDKQIFLGKELRTGEQTEGQTDFTIYFVFNYNDFIG